MIGRGYSVLLAFSYYSLRGSEPNLTRPDLTLAQPKNAQPTNYLSGDLVVRWSELDNNLLGESGKGIL